MIEARGLWMAYGEHVVLERLNAGVGAGEFVTLVGTSGCGKTTFLKLLLGIESASRGALLLDGAPIASEPGPDRGVVFQQYSVFPHLSVLGNVAAAHGFRGGGTTARLRGAARREAHDASMAMLARVGLETSASRWPHELSGGMRQRLALAQALALPPRVLLLDEPFGALDPGVRADMQALVLELWKELALTVFMVTHDLAEGFRLGTRLWVFDKPRHDPHAPHAHGATITYDLPLHRGGSRPVTDLPAIIEPA